MIFGSSANQAVSGNNTFYNIISNNTATLSLSDATQLKGLLTLNSGSFSTNNVLTLVSTASETGRIGPVTSATLLGNIYAQRYYSATGWRMVGSPVSGTTIADWDNELTTWGFPGSDNPSSSYYTVATYDETTTGTKEIGYVPPASTSDPIQTGLGYYIYAFNSGVTTDLYGTPHVGTITHDVTHTDDPAQPSTEDGWNMVANPYPCDIVWDRVGITSNISDFISIWDPNTSAYSTFDKASGTIIAQHQAFWVHVTSPGTGTLTFDEANKTTTSGTFYRAQPRYMDVVLERNGLEYKTQLRNHSDATNLYDVKFDGIYILTNYWNVPNIYTQALNPLENDTVKLAINSVNTADSAFVVPLYITNAVTDSFNITFANTYKLTESSCVLVEDVYSGASFALKDTSFKIMIYDTTQAPRFLIKVGRKIGYTKQDVICYGDSTGSITVDNTNDITTWNTLITETNTGDTITAQNWQ